MAPKKVLLLCGDYMEDYEVMVPFQALQAYGVSVDAACPGKKAGDVCRTAVHQGIGHQTYAETRGHNFALNASFDEISADGYDGLVIPGGRAPEYLAMNDKVLDLVRKFSDAKKPIASVCHGQLILAAAGVVQNRTCTAYPAVKPVLVAAGAKWDEPDTMAKCSVDGNLITAATYDSHPEFISLFVKALGGSVAGSDKKILFLCGDYMEDYEVMVPFQSLQALGCHVDAVCPDKGAGEKCPTAIHDFEGDQTYSETCTLPLRSHARSSLASSNPMAAARFLLAVALALLLRPGEASVHEYRGLGFANKGNAFILHAGSEGLYAAASPANATAEDDEDAAPAADAFIRFDKIIFRRPEDANDSVKETTSAKVQVLVFEIEDREMIGGSAYGGQKAICCTSDLAKLGACTEGSVIYRPSQVNPGWPKLFVASFDGSDLIATLPSRTIPITKTGMYNMYFIHCDPSLADLEIEGKTIWKNPTGYLPGRMSPLKNFFGLMSFAFVVLGIYWFYQYMKSWREVLPLQNCITLVITLGMLEMALWYFEYAEFNETGVRPKGITFWAVTFGTVKRTAAEIIVLIVSMGYGVVTPTLGGLTSKVVMLGGTFFLATETLELVENLGAVNDLSGKARLFLVYPVAILDAAFVIWIFISLAKTIGKLQARRLMAKLEIYRKFAIALIVSVLVSVGWIGYEIYFKSTDVFNERWQYAWIIPAFWHVLSFSLLCVICYLWAPSQNSMRFAYDASEFFDRKDNLALIRPASSASKNGWSLSSTPEVKATNTVGSFDEDDEENKRD